MTTKRKYQWNTPGWHRAQQGITLTQIKKAIEHLGIWGMKQYERRYWERQMMLPRK